jgi:hypothetical protein
MVALFGGFFVVGLEMDQLKDGAAGAGEVPGLDALLAPLPPKIQLLARDLVGQVAGYPGLSGKVMRGWRSVNFRHKQAGHVCAVFPYADRVSLYFEHGRMLDDPEGLLQGEDLKKGRFLRLYPGDAVPEAAVGLFIAEAIALFG